MNKKSNDGNKKFTKNEVEFINQVLQDRIIDLDTQIWNYDLITEIMGGVSDYELSEINPQNLFEKLVKSSDKEILEILIKSKVYWGMASEKKYKSNNMTSPKEKLLQISQYEDSSQFPLEWNPKGMTLLAFIMYSQIEQNDFVITLGESLKGNLTVWSTNKHNIHKLLDELTLSNQIIKIQRLEVIKENYFK